MEIVCTNKKELKEALKRKPEYIIVQGELADSIRKTNSYKDFKSKTVLPVYGVIPPNLIVSISIWAFILVMGIVLTIALFKNYEIEAEHEDGKIKFKVKRRLQ